MYLSSLTGSSDGDAPEHGRWEIARATYRHSIGYPDLCEDESVSFEISPSYRYFTATVGIANGADPIDQDEAVDFEVDSGSGSQLGSTEAQYGRLSSIKVKVSGLSSLTLDTSNYGGCMTGNGTVAVWGNPELTP